METPVQWNVLQAFLEISCIFVVLLEKVELSSPGFPQQWAMKEKKQRESLMFPIWSLPSISQQCWRHFIQIPLPSLFPQPKNPRQTRSYTKGCLRPRRHQAAGQHVRGMDHTPAVGFFLWDSSLLLGSPSLYLLRCGSQILTLGIPASDLVNSALCRQQLELIRLQMEQMQVEAFLSLDFAVSVLILELYRVFFLISFDSRERL